MKILKVLVGCEESQAVCKEFRLLGHEAYSCDIIECSGGHPEWHIQMDVFEVIKSKDWDLGIFFPPCTDLAVSGAKHFWYKIADGRQQKAIDFFLGLTKVPFPFCIENPVGIMSTHYRKPDQIIQPWMFGDPESKKTCLWLSGLPKLTATNILPLPESGRWENQTKSGQNKLPPSKDRARLRSVTYPGIAVAMASQFTNYLLNA